MDLVGQTIGQYQLVEVIHQDQNTVYRGFQASANRYVAVKVLAPNRSSDPTFVAQFQQDMQTLSSLSHPNLLPVLDYGQHNNLLYIVTPLVEGGSLKEHLADFHVLPQAQALFAGITDALTYLHRQDIVHANIRPSNIMLGHQGHPLLTDFGFSQGIDVGLSENAYLSPEIAQGQMYDQRADIYALGVLLDSVISGVNVVPGSLPNVRTRRPELAAKAEPIILKATAPQPEHRYQSVAEFEQGLTMALGGVAPVAATQPAAVVPPPVPAQSAEPAETQGGSSNMPLIIGGLVALLVIVGLGLFFLLFAGRGNDTGDGNEGGGGGIIIVVPTPAPQVPSVTADANVNIRSGPGTEFDVIGSLKQGQSAEALGRSPDQQWWVIKVAAANNGQGWVAANFVTTTNTGNLPVIQPPSPPAVATATATATTAPTPEPDSPPVAVIEGTSRAQVGDQVNLTGRNSQPAQGRTIVNYAWDFDEGTTATGRDVSHVYDTAGRYDVELTVTDDLGLTGSTTFRVRIDEGPAPAEPPVAVISAPADGIVGQPVTFDGSQSQSANRIVSYAWQFGDGGSANAVRVDHVYNAPGVYNVILTVTDNEGLTGSSNFQINIAAPEPEPEAPTAAISAPATTQVGVEVTFDGGASQSGSSAITTFAWDFGDGATDDTSGPVVNHTYEAIGSYQVTLTVINEEGLSDETAVNITVTPLEAAPLPVTVEPEDGQ